MVNQWEIKCWVSSYTDNVSLILTPLCKHLFTFADVGFEIPNRFVVGYALDYNEYFRDLNVSPEVVAAANLMNFWRAVENRRWKRRGGRVNTVNQRDALLFVKPKLTQQVSSLSEEVLREGEAAAGFLYQWFRCKCGKRFGRGFLTGWKTKKSKSGG